MNHHGLLVVSKGVGRPGQAKYAAPAAFGSADLYRLSLTLRFR
jgi:hypothetical protein